MCGLGNMSSTGGTPIILRAWQELRAFGVHSSEKKKLCFCNRQLSGTLTDYVGIKGYSCVGQECNNLDNTQQQTDLDKLLLMYCYVV